MSIDRRIYVATAIAAVIFGSAVLVAAPRDRYGEVTTIHGVPDAALPVGTGKGVVLHPDPAPAPGLVWASANATGIAAAGAVAGRGPRVGIVRYANRTFLTSRIRAG